MADATRKSKKRVGVGEITEVLGITPAVARGMLERGEIPGAARYGRNWSAPREWLEREVKKARG